MIELYKANGEVKHRAKLLYDFTELKVSEAKEAWLKAQEEEYKSLELEISFDEWLSETKVVQEAIEATEDTEAIEEVVELVREFVPPVVTEKELDEYLASINFARKQALDYLTSTDWYIVRFAETGVEIPAGVIAKRAEARLLA